MMIMLAHIKTKHLEQIIIGQTNGALQLMLNFSTINSINLITTSLCIIII